MRHIEIGQTNCPATSMLLKSGPLPSALPYFPTYRIGDDRRCKISGPVLVPIPFVLACFRPGQLAGSPQTRTPLPLPLPYPLSRGKSHRVGGVTMRPTSFLDMETRRIGPNVLGSQPDNQPTAVELVLLLAFFVSFGAKGFSRSPTQPR